MKSIQQVLSKRFRELWEAQNINTSVGESSVYGGHSLTITGGGKRTTTDGVHFVSGVATSNVKFADPYDAAGDWWCGFSFKPDADFSSASSTDQYLIGKYVDGTNYLGVYLRASDGKMCFDHTEGGSTEDVVTAETSWTGGTWYHVLVSKSNTNTKQRIRIDAGTAVEEANGTSISLIADVCVGARDDGTSTEGFSGVIANVVMGNDTLSDAEEINLARGVIPTDAVNYFSFDEGRGTTANDRGSGADNGTLDTSCTWSYGLVKRPVFSFDGINDSSATAGAADLSGQITWVWVGRMKSTCSSSDTAHVFFEGTVGTQRMLVWSPPGTTGIQLYVSGGTARTVTYSTATSYNDYIIVMATYDRSTDGIALYVNGALVGSDTNGVGDFAQGSATIYLGDSSVGSDEDLNQTLLLGILEGAESAAEVRRDAKLINAHMQLGLSI